MSRTIFTNVRVFDGLGGAPFDGEVLVEDNLIHAVERAGPLPRSDDARLVDGGGDVLMPGLIDGHTHLGLGTTVEGINPPRDRSPAESALLMAHGGRVMLDHGYTAGYSGGSMSAAGEVAAAAAFDKGWLPGPRLVTSSFERVPDGPMGLQVKFEASTERPAHASEIAAFVNEMADCGVKAVKFLLNGVSAFQTLANLVPQFHEAEIAAAAAVAKERGLWLTAHCYTPETVGLAVKYGFRILYHCDWADEATLDLIEAHKDQLFIGPSPGINEADRLRAPRFGVRAHPDQVRELDEGIERLKRVGTELRKRGVRSVPGGDYGFPWNPIGRNARDLELFVDWFGYSPSETLRAATSVAGELLALDTPTGRVEPGCYADLLLVHGDPTTDIAVLTDPANLRAIMKDGRFHKAPALH